MRLDPSVAADLFTRISVEQQDRLFGRLPVELVATLILPK